MDVDDNYSGMTVLESGLCHFMVHGADFLEIDDYMTIGALTKALRDHSFMYVRSLVYKMKIASENDFISTLTIYAKNDREVFRRSGNQGAIMDFLNYLKIAKAEPRKLDVSNYSHSPLDTVMEILHEYSELETVAMNPKCICIGDCLGLDRHPLMKDIESISTGAFLNNTRSVNSITIGADLLANCFDLVFNNNTLHIRACEQMDLFEASVKMMARCVRIQKANSTKMDQKYFAKLLSKMRVEELILLPMANEGTEMLNDQGVVVRHACIGCADLMFAKIADSRPLPIYWDDTEPKMKLKQLEYTALDMIPSTAIVDRMCSWFEVKRRMSLIFPKKRFRDDLMYDLEALCPYLKEFKGDVILLTFKCIKPTARDGCARFCVEAAEMFENKGFSVMRTHFDAEKERFELDLDQNYVEKKIVVDFARPPPSLDVPMEIPEYFAAFYGNDFLNRY